MLRYTLLRLLVFFGCVALLWLLGLRTEDQLLILVVGAALLSMVISYFALARFRKDYSAQLAERLERRAEARAARPATVSADDAAEDAEVSRHEPGGPPAREDDGDFR
jgi:hypothetical protein